MWSKAPWPRRLVFLYRVLVNDPVLRWQRRFCGPRTLKGPGLHCALCNGDLGDGGQIYLVRDVYFEPSLGHDAKNLVRTVIRYTSLGRPVLIETHRLNFIESEEQALGSLNALEDGLSGILRALPEVRFMSSVELADAIREDDTQLVEQAIIPRMRVWLRRIDELHLTKRLVTATGMSLILWIMRKTLRV